MARTKRKTNPVIPAAEAPAQAQKQYRAAAYARLSVEDSGKPGADTIEGQKNLLLRFIENDPTLSLYGLFCDNGLTGTDFQRPEFEKLMEAVKRGDVDCIVVKDLSRFGRNYKETGNYLERIFPFLGVRFIAVNDGFDTLTAQRGADGYLVPLKISSMRSTARTFPRSPAPRWPRSRRTAISSARGHPTATANARTTRTGWNRMRQRLPLSGRYSGGVPRALASRRSQGGLTTRAYPHPPPICTIPARAKQKSTTV